jgi:dipeptidyl aminopeptidase/acylaminoacyl peptidase
LLRLDPSRRTVTTVAAGLTPELNYRPEVAWAGWMGEDPILFARPAGGVTSRPDWFRLRAEGPVNLTARLPAAPRAVRALGPSSLTFLVDGRLWRVDANGDAQVLAAGPVAAVHEPRPPAGRADLTPPAGSWLVTGAPAQRQVRWIDGAGLHPGLDLPPDGGTVVAVSPDGAAALLQDTNDRRVESLRLVRQDHPPQDVARWNAGLADVDPDTVLPVSHRGPDGQPLTSWLLLPSRRPGAAPPPLVVQAYAGSSYPTAPLAPAGVIGFATEARLLTGHGYAVLIPSLPNPSGPHEPMAGLAGQILAVVDVARVTQGLAGRFDPDRLAIWGHSYGGFTVMAAIGQTDRFRAAVSIAGLSDQTAVWSALPVVHRTAPEDGSWSNWNTGNSESGQNRMGGPPWRDPGRYQRNSPLLAADRINTPLLLIHGDQDFIPLAQSEAMFSALYRQAKDALLVTYWGEGHYISSPGNVRDFYARAFAFLDARLKVSSQHRSEAIAASPGSESASGAPSSRASQPRRSPSRHLTRSTVLGRALPPPPAGRGRLRRKDSRRAAAASGRRCCRRSFG